MQDTNFHPNSDVPASYLPGNSYTCGACGEEDALEVWNSDGVVVAKCYGGCY